MRIVRVVFLSLLSVGLAIVSANTAIAQPDGTGIQIKPIGNPTWKPVDFHLYTAAIGTADDGYAEFTQNQIALLPPPNHQLCSRTGHRAGSSAPASLQSRNRSQSRSCGLPGVCGLSSSRVLTTEWSVGSVDGSAEPWHGRVLT